MAELLAGAAAVVPALLAVLLVIAIVVLFIKAWPWAKKAFNLLDALAGLAEFVKRTDDRLKRIDHELTFNSGASVKDAVHRIDDAVVEIRSKVAVLEAQTKPTPTGRRTTK